MAGLNKVMIIGRLGADPELRYSPQGLAVTRFSVATSEERVDKNTGEKQERTEWHRVVVFDKIAEVCAKYLSKGRQVYVEGKLQTSSYDKDGQKHYSTDIIANTVQFLDPKQDGGGYNQQGQAGSGGYTQQGGGQSGYQQQGSGQGGYQPQRQQQPPPPPQQNMGGGYQQTPSPQMQPDAGIPSNIPPEDDIPF
ncbi:MAG: single-stranded DNA-binding protein [Desulfamplus sp.]|nr:single-stranded DNA-binding protein [Desulfamplus sp.]